MTTVDPAVAWTLRLSLALLFVDAAWQKLRAPDEFAGAVRAYRLVPERLAAALAAALLLGEVAAAALLVAPAWSRAGALLAAALLVLYAAAIAINLRRGRRDLDCGCGGPGRRRPVSGSLVVRNLALAATALVPFAPRGDRALGWLDGVTILAATFALAALWTAVVRLDANRPALARLRGVA